MASAEARAGVESGDIGVVIDLAPGTGRSLTAARMFAGGSDRAKLTLWVDPSRQIEANIVQGLLTEAMMETVFGQLGNPTGQMSVFNDLRAGLGDDASERPELAHFLDQGAAFSKENEARAAAQAPPGSTGSAGSADPAGTTGGMSLRAPLDVVVESVVAAGPTAGFNGFAHTFAGMLMQFLLFTASSQAKTVFGERASGLLDRVRMTRASPTAILLGAGASIAVVSLLATTVVFGVGMIVCDIHLRSGVLAFALVAIGQAAFVGAYALFLLGLADSEKQLDSIGTLVILFLCFIGGAWVPSFMLPSFLQGVGPLVPTRWILDGMAGATWRGLGIEHALKCTAVLFVYSAVMAGVGLRRFRWQ